MRRVCMWLIIIDGNHRALHIGLCNDCLKCGDTSSIFCVVILNILVFYTGFAMLNTWWCAMF